MRKNQKTGIFESDFGTLYVHPSCTSILNGLARVACMDGRKRRSRKAKQELLEMGSALNIIARLALRSGVEPNEVILKSNKNKT